MVWSRLRSGQGNVQIYLGEKSRLAALIEEGRVVATKEPELWAVKSRLLSLAGDRAAAKEALERLGR